MATPDHFADDRFEVSASPETVVESSEHEGANVCRVAALSTMLGNDREGIQLLSTELEQVGFSARIRSGDWNWAETGVVESFADIRDRDAPNGESRIRRWQMIAETTRPQAAVAFLVDVLGSRLERESVAAAAALWRQIQPFETSKFWRDPRGWHMWDRILDLWDADWPIPGLWESPWGGGFGVPNPEDTSDVSEMPWDAERWSTIYERAMARIGDPYGDVLLIRMLCGWRLGRGMRSPDPVARSLAMAAFPPPPQASDEIEAISKPAATPPGALVVSTMIHGTFGWKGDWWRPRSTFHEFILRSHRPNLYSRGAKFSWSGAYSAKQRAQAATDFCEWAHDVAPNGLQTVFAHSYSGEVAARAVASGARVTELVLLSAPVTPHVEVAAATNVRVVDVRLGFDLVLGLARLRQRLRQRMRPRPNVTEVLLDWRYDHGASHREDVWRAEDVARRGGI